MAWSDLESWTQFEQVFLVLLSPEMASHCQPRIEREALEVPLTVALVEKLPREPVRWCNGQAVLRRRREGAAEAEVRLGMSQIDVKEVVEGPGRPSISS